MFDKLKEIIALEIKRLIETMFNQYICKAKTNDELLRELNEIYVYYYRQGINKNRK